MDSRAACAYESGNLAVTQGNPRMNSDHRAAGQDALGAPPSTSWARSIAPSFLAGALLGLVAMIDGAPELAFLITLAVSTALGVGVHVVERHASSAPWAQHVRLFMHALRDLTKP